VIPTRWRRLRRNAGLSATSISMRAGTSVATRSVAPPDRGVPVVAAITEGSVGDGRSRERTTICVNAAVERSRIVARTSAPTAVRMNASPSCTP